MLDGQHDSTHGYKTLESRVQLTLHARFGGGPLEKGLLYRNLASGLPDYTRGTGVVTPLDYPPARTRWMWAGLRCALSNVGEELRVGSVSLDPGGHGEWSTA
jgi:hypothetical protein